MKPPRANLRARSPQTLPTMPGHALRARSCQWPGTAHPPTLFGSPAPKNAQAPVAAPRRGAIRVYMSSVNMLEGDNAGQPRSTARNFARFEGDWISAIRRYGRRCLLCQSIAIIGPPMCGKPSFYRESCGGPRAPQRQNQSVGSALLQFSHQRPNSFDALHGHCHASVCAVQDFQRSIVTGFTVSHGNDSF